MQPNAANIVWSFTNTWEVTIVLLHDSLKWQWKYNNQGKMGIKLIQLHSPNENITMATLSTCKVM